MEVSHNIFSIFQVENVSPGKQKKTLNIYDTIQPIFIMFSPKLSKFVWPSNFFTDDIEIVDQGQNL